MFVETKPQTMTTTNETASVLIFSSVDDIRNDNPRRLKFEFLSGAQKYAEMLSTSNRFLSIQVLDHEGQIHCEYENWP